MVLTLYISTSVWVLGTFSDCLKYADFSFFLMINYNKQYFITVGVTHEIKILATLVPIV